MRLFQTPANLNMSDHASLVEIAQDALLSLTPEGVVRTWNPAATRLLGYAAAEAIGCSVSLFAAPSQCEQQKLFIQDAREGRSTGPIETTRLRRDGSTVDVELTLTPIRDGQGRVVSLAGALRDISGRKRADAQRTRMTNELTHRLKNALAVVQSIAMQTLRDATSLDAFSETFFDRLAALSNSHDLLSRSANQPVAFADLVTAELTPYGDPTDFRWRASGPAVFLGVEQVLPMGMILHELATNAAKHGALSTAAGRVDLSWTLPPPPSAPRLSLTWSESGGPVVEQPTRKGFGTRLIADSVAYDLEGELALTFDRRGMTCKIDIPLAATGEFS